MDVSGGLSLVQTILQMLGSPIWMKIEAVLGVESQLDKLKATMSTIEAVLLDAEEIEQLQQYRFSHVERNRLQRLKEALYRVDDLFDEIATLDHLKELMPCYSNKLCNEVCLFFSRSNQFRSALAWSQEMESIMEMLDDIVKDHRFDSGLRHPAGLNAKQVRINERETDPFLCETDDIIGRGDDIEKVIDILLNTTVEENVSILCIVGIGGLGKTTLARQVYNDDRIGEKVFPLKMWVCVSDDFNVKALVGQILAATNPKSRQEDDSSMDQLQKELNGKKYLLVLDDVWNEDTSKWRELIKLLIGGGRGSRIIVTTRSKCVADVVESCWTHELKGLSDDDSWNLFQKMALKPEECPIKKELADIGRAIVLKCANVPLAIRVVGSLLRGQDERRWEHLKNTDLAKIVQDDINGIIPVLKISYNYLPSHLKSCFTYCAVFPKDCKIIKEDLICLWMAQGLILASDGESFEDVGEEYFKQLLQRCFFQDVERVVGTDEIISCKMHDLIHDLAKEVAGQEILPSDYSKRCFNEKTRHVVMDRSAPEYLFDELTKVKRMRTFLCIGANLPFGSEGLVVEVLKMKYLRALSLNDSDLKTLPSVIGELVHLRYLDLSDCMYLRLLPTSIAKLYNLQTLKLCGCGRLKSLPRELRKLVNLRHLDISRCRTLKRLPRELRKLVNLRHLDISGCLTLKRLPRELRKLVNLRHLKLENLNEVEYVESSSDISGADDDVDELVFFPSLENLVLDDLPKLKGWWKSESKSNSYSFPRLSHLSLRGCPDLTTFPSCPKLEELELCRFNGELGPIMRGTSDALSEGQGRLRKVEISNVGYLNSLPIHSFHHLSHLRIDGDENIERLTTGEAGEVFRSGRLSSLRSLKIQWCSNLKSISGRGVWEHFTALESLKLKDLIRLEMEDEDDVSDAEMPWRYLAPTLRSLGLYFLPKLVKLPKGIGCLSSLQSLRILGCSNLETLPPSIGGLSSLQSLEIIALEKLKSMPEEMRHLTSLTRLDIRYCSTELKKRCEELTGPISNMSPTL